ncbi:glycosyltransferase [Erythrobacter sp. W53]|uniref:glycosyltransferase n=1 Tax=Erythrobacter sp. W53 TaxID=3425947 RepID=UPI003D76A3CE
MAELGVIAIGRNEGERLVRCLTSLQCHDLPVVYVDSASTDGSQTRAKELGAHVLPLDMDRPFTAARARAEGFAELMRIAPDLQFVMFVDGDCEIVSSWPSAAMSFLLENTDYAAVCGRRKERFPEASAYNALIDQEWDTPIGEAAACGGDAVFRISAYQAVGGFNPAMIAGEEPELCARLRGADWRIMRLDEAMTVHDAALERYGQYWNRAVRSGLGYMQANLATKTAPGGPLYGREIIRAVCWALLLPLASFALAWIVHPIMLLLWPALTGAQWLRLMARDGVFAATLSMTGKFAELLGIARFQLRRLRGQTGGTVEYK